MKNVKCPECGYSPIGDGWRACTMCRMADWIPTGTKNRMRKIKALEAKVRNTPDYFEQRYLLNQRENQDESKK